EEITTYHSVTTLFRHLVSALTGAEHFPRLRLVQVGGGSNHQEGRGAFQTGVSCGLLPVRQPGSHGNWGQYPQVLSSPSDAALRQRCTTWLCGPGHGDPPPGR